VPHSDVFLHEVPERFFDPVLWNEYLSISFYRSREASLAELGYPEPGLLGLVRLQLEERPWLHTSDTKLSQRRAKLRENLVSNFRGQLVSGKLVATGFSSFAAGRVTIPPERWHELRPDFVNDRAKGGSMEFTGIRIAEAAESPIPSPDLLSGCAEWMKKRGQEGESRKKVLQRRAMELFGEGLTTRLFDAAYKQTFSKPRGRPRLNKSNLHNPQ
jgi:hypothetical protein